MVRVAGCVLFGLLLVLTVGLEHLLEEVAAELGGGEGDEEADDE